MSSKPAARARDSGPLLTRQTRQSAKAGETAATCPGRESAVFWQAAISPPRRLYAPCQRCRWHWLKSVTIPTQPPERTLEGCSLESASTKEVIMRTALPKQTPPTRSHRPRAVTVFAAAFVAGAAAAVGVNRTLDVRMAQSKPRVESEAIFVALRSLPQGSPVTVWDVALRDWPKAMMPATALRASDTFSGHVLKHPLREGQPLLSIQLAPSGQSVQPAAEPPVFPPPAAYTQSRTPVVPTAEGDLWSPAAPVEAVAHPPVQPSAPPAVSQPAPLPTPQVAMLPEQATTPPTAGPVATIPVPEIAQQTGTPSETPSLEPATSAATDQSLADNTAATTDSTTTPEVATPEENAAAQTAEAVVAEPVATAAQPASDLVTERELTAVAPSVPASSDIPEPFAALPPPPLASTTPIAPAPIAVTPPTPPAPLERPRPTHSRYLVVPESIAVQADASFAARAAAPQQPAESSISPAPQAASNAIRPLPATTTADRGPQSRPQGNSTQPRAPQRQGRQAQPATPGTAPGTPPQPRLGAAVFPNLSAGIDAIEGRMRGEQPAQGQAPAAAQTRPLTAR
jgi:hypothetical protein